MSFWWPLLEVLFSWTSSVSTARSTQSPFGEVAVISNVQIFHTQFGGWYLEYLSKHYPGINRPEKLADGKSKYETHFMYNFFIVIQIRWKISFSVTPL